MAGDSTGLTSTMNVGGEKAHAHAAKLAAIHAQNRTRVPCQVCGVPILPANYWRHVGLHKD